VLSSAGWVRGRLIPLLALSAAAGFLAAWARFEIGFSAGLQGMALGVLLGWVAGRLARRDPESFWSFSQRLWTAADMLAVFAVSHLVALSVLRSGGGRDPLAWLEGVLSGTRREFFASMGGIRGRRSVVSGNISGGWWVFLNATDLALMGFMMLLGQMLGLTPGDREVGDERAARNAFPLLAVLLVASPVAWRAAVIRGETRAREAASAELAGDWELEGWGGLVGSSAAAHRFTLFLPHDRMNDLGGVSKSERKWILLLSRGKSGFEGTLALPDRDMVPVTVRLVRGGDIELEARLPSGETSRGAARRVRD
jgi:hypothetical protein